MGLYFILHLVWLWLSWQVLIYFNSVKNLEIQTETYGEHTTSSFVIATNSQRLANILIDSILAVLIYSVLIDSIIRADFENNFILKMQRVTGEYVALCIVIFICRTLYYVVFETMFGATPAKFITETRVIKNDGKKAAAGTILVRTLSRFIPFEVFSFIFGLSGWHDRISATSVIKEKRTGVKGGWYILIIPAVFLMWWLTQILSFRFR